MVSDPSQIVGERLRAARLARGWSAKELAAAGDLALNTIGLIERGKMSPTVATLHKLANALGVPLSFFVDEPERRAVAFHKRGERPQARGIRVGLENLGTPGASEAMEAILLTLEPGADSGPDAITHGGFELVFCLEGRIAYTVEGEDFVMEPEDSLFFEARLPHGWHNLAEGTTRILLVAQSRAVGQN